MQIKVNYADVFEVSLHHFQAEASTLGLPPGKWPAQITTDDMGNKQAFHFVRRTECGSHVYHQMLGCLELVVVND